MAATEEPLMGYPVRPVIAYFPPLLLVPASSPRPSHRSTSHNLPRFALFFFIALFGFSVFLIWPRSIDISVVNLNLGKIHLDVKKGDALIPQVFIDMAIDLRLQARNPNFFGVSYDTLTMKILFEGDEIGRVQSQGAELAPLATSNVNATLVLNGYQITSNVLKLLVDVASGMLPLHTVTGINGHLDLFLFQLPLEGKVSCSLLINLQDQVVLTQECVA